MNNETRKLPSKVKIGYGSTGFAGIMTLSTFIMYGMFFLTDAVGLDPAFAGIILSIGTLWDAISDPLVGAWSDNRDPQKGRRRPFMKWVAIPFGLITWCLFNSFGLTGTSAKIYFILIAVAFYTVQTLLDVPYTALGGEMTLDYDERSSLNSNRNLFATISGILGSFTLMMVFGFADMFGSIAKGWSATAAIFGIMATITILIGYKVTEGYELTTVKPTESHNPLEFIKDVFKNKVFLFTAGLFAFSIISLTVQNASIVYFLIYFLNFTDVQITMALLVAWIPGLVWIPIINYMCQKWSKKIAWIICMGIWAAGLAIFMLFVLTPTSSFFIVALFQLCAGIGLVAQYQIVWSMIPDAVEVDEYKTGLRREGSYYGLIAFIQKALTAITMLITGIILTNIGYVPNVAQTPETLEGMKILIGGGGAFFLVISMILAYANPMNRDKHKKLVEGIEQKKQGITPDESGFSDLL